MLKSKLLKMWLWIVSHCHAPSGRSEYDENLTNICQYMSSVSAGTLPAPLHQTKTFQQKSVLNDFESINFS